MRNILSLFLLFLALSAFTTQPLDERKAQNILPISHDPLWAVLAKTRISVDPKKGFFKANIPAEVKALNGTEISMTGFMLPLESKEKFHHFLLSKRTPTCPFCPPGEPNEIVDVQTKEAVKWTDEVVTVKGTFGLMNDREMGLFFKLSKANVH